MDRFADFSDQPMDVTYAAHDDNWLINIVMELVFRSRHFLLSVLTFASIDWRACCLGGLAASPRG